MNCRGSIPANQSNYTYLEASILSYCFWHAVQYYERWSLELTKWCDLRVFVMINYHVHLTGHEVPRLNISSGVCPHEISILIGGLRNIDCPSQWGWTSYNLLRVWKEQKAEEEWLCPLFSCLTVWAGSFHLIFSGP